MSNRSRLLLNNVYYHVLARGNQKQNIFFKEEDFNKYEELLRHYKRKYGFRLFAYCLMPNHIHLILDVNKPTDLAKIMQGLNLAYAKWFNAKYKKVGHLWQGRYKSMVIEKNRYILNCIEYVESNPVRANITNSPADYLWSSWQTRIMRQKHSLSLDNPEI